MDPMSMYAQLVTSKDPAKKAHLIEFYRSGEAENCADAQVETADGRSLRVTKFPLASVSPYFRALFYGSMSSGGDSDSKVQNSKSFKAYGIKAEIMAMVIRYSYIGEWEGFTESNVAEVLYAADFLMVEKGIEKIGDFMIQNLNKETALDYYRITQTYYLPEVHKAAINVLLQECSPEWSHKMIQSMTVDEIEMLLKDDLLAVPREEITYQLIVKWIESDFENRKGYFANLLKHVRFGNAAVNFIENEILNKSALVQQSDELRDYLKYVDKVLKDIQKDPVPAKFDVVKHPFLRPRIPRDIVFTFGGWSASSATCAVETYDSRVNKWYSMETKETGNRAYHGMVYFKGLIYVIGGFDGRTHFSSVVAFDPVTKQWEEKGYMSQARCYVSCAVLGDHIYACGGFNGQVRMASCERYDLSKNQWSPIPAMTHARSDASAAVVDGKLYVVGGFDGTDVLSSVEFYDPQIQKWTRIAHMFTPRSGVQALSLDDKLYVFGGNDGLRRQTSAEVYDPQTYNWSILPSMRVPRSNFACVAVEGVIFIIGGFNGQTTISDVECYYPNKKLWYDMWPMTMTRSALTACVVSRLPNGKEYTWLRRELKPTGASDRPRRSAQKRD